MAIAEKQQWSSLFASSIRKESRAKGAQSTLLWVRATVTVQGRDIDIMQRSGDWRI